MCILHSPLGCSYLTLQDDTQRQPPRGNLLVRKLNLGPDTPLISVTWMHWLLLSCTFTHSRYTTWLNDEEKTIVTCFISFVCHQLCIIMHFLFKIVKVNIYLYHINCFKIRTKTYYVYIPDINDIPPMIKNDARWI